MNFPAILIANFTAICLMLLILTSSQKTSKYTLVDEKLYYNMAIMTILQCLLEIISYFIDGKTYTGYIPLSYLVNSLLYIINILFAFTWTLYADFKLFEDKERLKKYYPFVAIPAILITLGAIVNFFTPVFYTISSDNLYARTSLYIIPYAFTYLYLAYGVVLIYTYRNKVGKYMFLPAIVFMIPIAIGSLIQFFFYGYSLIWLGVAVAMVSLYINVQAGNYYIDMLSGLFTRQYLYNYLQTHLNKRSKHSSIAGIMLDIDQFKQINDTYGHLMGDQAIASAGHILHSVMENDGFASRFAGDEFVLIQIVKSEKSIQKTLDKIQQKTDSFNKNNKASYQISFSYGYSLLLPDESIESFLNRLDQKMYQDKKLKHMLNE